jgi:hypothetical protein
MNKKQYQDKHLQESMSNQNQKLNLECRQNSAREKIKVTKKSERPSTVALCSRTDSGAA